MLPLACNLTKILCQRGLSSTYVSVLQYKNGYGFRRSYSVLVSRGSNMCLLPVRWNKGYVQVLSTRMSSDESNIKSKIESKSQPADPKTITHSSQESAATTLEKSIAHDVLVKEILVKGGKIVVSGSKGDGSKSDQTQVTGIIITKDLSEPPIEALKQSATPGNVDLSSIKTMSSSNETAPKPNVPPPVKKRKRVDHSASSLERNFITPVRAMSDFLLKPSDLETLPKTKRRSPYELEPPIIVHWRKDVEALAIKVWGSMDNLRHELLKREIERKTYQQNVFTQKRRLRDYRREIGSRSEPDSEVGLRGRSGRVVMTAVMINAANFFFKLIAWGYTGSHSMFSESIHSLADTVNQLILAYGIHKSVQMADPNHPYGYTNMKYVASLISGVGIFCVGSGLSIYHGVIGLINPSPIDDFYWAYCILGGSLISEGATLIMAFSTLRKGAKEANVKVKDYILRGQDPSVNVVLLEDSAAVLGVACAAGCMALSTHIDSHIPDAVGSLLIGGLLAGVASFIIYSNVAALVGRSISTDVLEKMNSALESDIMIRAIHDVKGIDMGNSLVRYKAELDFDGRELTRAYLDKMDLNNLLEEVKKFHDIDELEEFLLTHGENIVDLMGGEIDRIELKLRNKFPQIRHCDLEIL